MKRIRNVSNIAIGIFVINDMCETLIITDIVDDIMSIMYIGGYEIILGTRSLSKVLKHIDFDDGYLICFKTNISIDRLKFYFKLYFGTLEWD